jgi:transmembrane sensor
VTRLQLPIKDHLRDPVDEAALQRIWMQIDGRFPVLRRHRRRAVMGTLALAGAAVVALTFGLRRDAGPLRLGDGRALFAVDAPEGGARLSLSDGSSIELAAGARFEPLESSGTMFLAVLQRGTAAFEVRPGGPRRWQIECGLATVEVVGTRFSCERLPGRLRVAVQRGSVIVRGERVADRARRLGAGESLDVAEGALAVDAAAASALPELPALDETLADEAAPLVAQPSRPSATSPISASWRELARGGRHGEAFAALGEGGVRRETQRLSVSDLLALADVARLSGHPREAVAPLERILARFASDPQAPLAAFALGRLELDALDQPRRAATALERALALGVPRSLKEDVRARLVEAYGRAGDRARAREAARAYLREFPDGRERAEMETQAASD